MKSFITALLLTLSTGALAHEMQQCEIDLLPPPAPEDSGQRIYEASTITGCYSGFLTRYGTRARDADPVNGVWQCSDEQLGGSMPSGSVQAPTQPTTPTNPTPAPETPVVTGSLRVEAESATLSQGWVKADGGTSVQYMGGSRYLLSSRKDQSNLTYKIEIETAGNYRVTMRSRAQVVHDPSEPGNDVWLKFGTVEWIKAFMNRDGNWHVDAIGERGHTQSRELITTYLPKGTATITLSGRSDGHAIDWIELVPVGFTVDTSTSGDLILIHSDSYPDQDDHQAILLARHIADTKGLDLMTVVGTHGEDPNDPPHLSFIGTSPAFWMSLFPNTLDAYNDKQNSAATVARAIESTIKAGYKVHIAEGGPSDFTARALRLTSGVDLKKVHVYQHSVGATAFNEDKTIPANLAYVKSATTYVTVPNGNIGGNGSADLQEPASSAMCQRFMQRALSSQYGAQWREAYGLIGDERKCDASDAVGFLWIIGDTTTRTFDDVAGRYLR